MSTVSTHVLDTALGRPAAGVPVRLERAAGIAGPEAAGSEIAAGRTDEDGRVTVLGTEDLLPGTYRLVFDTAAYYRARPAAEPPFFPEVAVTFTMHDRARNYHVPLLLSPFGYSTYRGS